MKKNKMNRIIGLVLALVLIVGNLGQVRDPTVVYADKVGQNEQNVSEDSAPGVEDSGKDTTETPKEEGEAAQDAEAGEDGSEEAPDIDTNGAKDSQADSEDVDSVDADQADAAEDVVENNVEIMPQAMTYIGYNLYTGDTVEDANYIGTYTTWDTLVAAIKAKGVGVYSIDLYDMDLTPPKNWNTAFTSGTEQYFLHFYSSTYESTGIGEIKLVEESVMGAHLQFHSGVGLNTPVSTGAGNIPFSNSLIASTHSVSNYRSGAIYANGWRFIVDKGVRVTGGPAILYAGNYETNFHFDTGKTVLTNEEKTAEGIQTSEDILTGYIEVNSGNWRLLSGYILNGYGAYRIKAGTKDDPGSPVKIDAAIGKSTSSNYFYPLTPSPDIPSEYIEINGNTIVNYGVAIMTAGNSNYRLNPNASKLYTTQKVKISGNVSILSTFGGVTPSMLPTLTSANRSDYNRISVSANAVSNGYDHYLGNNAIVNTIVEISGNAHIAGDVIGNGPNMYFNVHSDSKGVHLYIKDRAQIGGNIAYGGSSRASTVTPNDSVDNPFFTIDITGSDKNHGADDNNGVKIGGSVIATNGEDRSSDSSWNVATTIVNARVNGSVFGFGNLSNQESDTGMKIKTAKVVVEDSIVGGGVYGVATGTSSESSTEEVSITIDHSRVGHVAPLFTLQTQHGGGGSSSNYPLGRSNISITDSTITGRSVMWMSSANVYEARNLTLYAFVGEKNGVVDYDLKAMADVQVASDGTRTFACNTDEYEGVPLETTRPDISLTTSMVQDRYGMRLGNNSIGLKVTDLASYPGIHKLTVKNSNFTRENGNPIIAIMDTGDGTLGTSASVTLDNCHATALDKKIDASIFGSLTGDVTTTKMGEMSLEVKNTNDIESVGFVNSDSNYFINTKAKITLENTVVDSMFGKKGSTAALRNVASSTNRLQYVFKGNNTVGEVLANGADIVFDVDSISYISGKINNTSATVFDNEWVDVKKGSQVYLGNTGAPANKAILGDAKAERIFGSIQGTDGEVYIYTDTSDMLNAPNLTYPIYVAVKGQILSSGMGLGEWTSLDGSILTKNKNDQLNASTGLNKDYKITEPKNSKNSSDVQMENDVLIAFGTVANAIPTKINDVPLRPWPLIKYKDVNPGITNTDERNGWLILGKPRYQVMYKGTGFLEEDRDEVTGLVTYDLMNMGFPSITSPADTTYYYTESDPSLIEDIFAVPDNPGYEFLYWELYSTVEEVDENGLLQKDKWIPADEIANTALPPFENKWEAGDQIKLMEFLKEGRLDKSNSKMLMLIPVYKANYVCKIGNKGYLTLADAFNAINTNKATPELDGSYNIQMLVEEYAIKETHTVEWDKSIQITTASPNDAKLPYLGTEGSRCVLKRQDVEPTIPMDSYKNAFFNVEGKLSIRDLVLDGNYKEQTPVIENGKVVDYLVVTGSTERIVSDAPLISMSTSGSLTLGADSWLINNKTTSAASAIYGNGGNILLEDTVVRDNISTSINGGGILTGGGPNLTLKGKVIVDHNNIDSGDVQEKSNVCLIGFGRVMISGSMTEGSSVGIRVIPSDHIDEYVFAQADTELAASDSYQYLSDDYADALDIEINPINKEEIRFVDTVPFAFTKVKAEDTDTALNGAKFDLYRLNCTDGSHNHTDLADLVSQESIDSGCWELIKTDTSGGPGKADGLVDMGALRKGTYMLVESGAVKGYKLPTGQWMINITPTGLKTLSITAHGPSDDMPPAFMMATTPEGDVQYKLPNIRLLAIPMSGMPGIQKFLLIGGGLLSVTIMLYILRKRRDDRLGSKD